MVDFRRKQGSGLTQLNISGEPVERVPSFKYLRVNLTRDLSWSLHTKHLVSKSDTKRHRLYFLWRLTKFKASPSILRTFYSAAVESSLTGCISAWYGSCTAQDRAVLQRVVERTIRSSLPNLEDT
jgi:hypothetical protein